MALPSVFVVGDSICSPTYLGYDAFPERLTGINQLSNISNSSDSLVAQIEPTYGADLATRYTYSIAIIQGGVNDAVSQTLADTKTALTSCVSLARAWNKDVFVLSIAPWKGSGSWTTDRQTFTDDYNTWLAAQASVQGFTFIDVYGPLEDPSNPDQLLPAYSVDGIHPTEAGAAAMAVEVQAAIDPFLVDTTPETFVNDLKMWRGAVEPAETGAAGNEIQLWRGAVEPAAPVSSTSDALIGGVTRSVTRTLTRGVTEGWSWGA